MKSQKHGKNTLNIEIQNISKNGIWLLAKGKEYFLDAHHYPWFKKAKIEDILDVRLLHGHHLHWPELDIDLDLKSLEEPKKYPLVFH